MDQIDVLPLAHRICELRDNLTAYEAAYLAVAEDLGCTRFTSDAAPALANGSARGVVLNSPPVVRGS